MAKEAFECKWRPCFTFSCVEVALIGSVGRGKYAGLLNSRLLAHHLVCVLGVNWLGRRHSASLLFLPKKQPVTHRRKGSSWKFQSLKRLLIKWDSL